MKTDKKIMTINDIKKRFMKIFFFLIIIFVVKSSFNIGGRESTIPKEPSYMYALIENGSVTFESIEENIERNSEFAINSKTLEEDILQYVIKYKNTEFIVDINITEIGPLDNYINIHGIKDAEYEKVINTTNAVGTKMDFVGSNIDSYHFQLKLLKTIAPNMLAVVDNGSYNILSEKWVDTTAKTRIPPPSSYIRSIFVINDSKNDRVWLYTFGLRRCGSLEIEIVNSNGENYSNHYRVLDYLSQTIISHEYLPKSKELIHSVMRDVNLTWIPTTEALKDVERDGLASMNDRENIDYQNTAVIYSYKNLNAAKRKKISPISAVNDILKNDPAYYLGEAETRRRTALATKTWEYTVNAVINPKYDVHMQFAILADYKFGDPLTSFRHLWFSVSEINGEEVTGVLLNDFDEISGMKLGDEVKLKKSQLTDWIILNDRGEVILPDIAYKLDE